ncbi:hypothetical protein ALC60_10424 [Trachymyrmex zeteki]|uniref:Uncharacterized protein n=1 Tax=Mycetomoellerius zeteki TaxID=64791 RepID=A0A151WRQ2_9HYME|nr:hypothetical protein ALC60_10424 [Trachymyrmex zeteki]
MAMERGNEMALTPRRFSEETKLPEMPPRRTSEREKGEKKGEEARRAGSTSKFFREARGQRRRKKRRGKRGKDEKRTRTKKKKSVRYREGRKEAFALPCSTRLALYSPRPCLCRDPIALQFHPSSIPRGNPSGETKASNATDEREFGREFVGARARARAT